MWNNIHGIVLSKDRAAQLHLFLQSLAENDNNFFSNISVLYKSTNEDFENGYRFVKEEFSSVNWLNEFKYYEDIMHLVHVPSKYVAFFTDDDIIYRKIPVNNIIIDDYMSSRKFDVNTPLCFSLRLGLNTYIQDQYTGQHVIPPELLYDDGPILAWDWTKVPNYTNFGYPFSVDGHIFERNLMIKLLSEIKFNNPNQQEVAMSTKVGEYASPAVDKKWMLSFKDSVLINTPLNRVQEVCLNRSGESFGISPEDMNKNFLEGKTLSLEDIDFSNIVGCHQELSMTWKQRTNRWTKTQTLAQDTK